MGSQPEVSAFDSQPEPVRQTSQELQDEQRKLRRLQIMVNMVMSVISQDMSLTIDEASEMVADTRRLRDELQLLIMNCQMSDADRQAMIHTMVDKLAGELKANPHDSGGWVRLMRARMVLGESDKAAEAYRQARQAFAGTPAAQVALQEAAKSLGVPGA